MKGMRVFVTGGTGFVGRYVVRELLKEGYRVHLGVRDPRKARSLFGDRVQVHEVDFSSPRSVLKVLEEIRPTYLVHLIGILYEERSKGLTFEEVHYRFSVNLYEAALKTGVRKAVHMSALGTHDRAPSRYHRTKRWAEKHLMESGLNYVILRPSLILGPEQRLFRDMDRITRWTRTVALPGGGSYRFQPVDVRDVAQVFVRCLRRRKTDGKVFELCGTRTVTFKQLLGDVFSFLRRKVLMIPVPKTLMFYGAKFMELFLDPPPFSSDQMLMMWKDNVCGAVEDEAVPDGVREILERDPVPYEESLRWSLETYLSGGSSL
jgi:NADH dehydrogenase